MKIIKLSAIDSTNSYLKTLSREIDLPDSTVVMAHCQTAGRGQRASSWQSRQGESLTFSVYKRFTAVAPDRQFELLMAVSLALKKVLESFGVPDVSVKWPNDILSRSKKICGILIENTLTGSTISASVIGVGLNVNETEFVDLPKATSMRLETEIEFDLDAVLRATVDEIVSEISLLEKPRPSLHSRYESALFGRNEKKRFELPNGETFAGTICGVGSQGALFVETEKTGLRKFQFKEVKLLF